MKKTIYTLLLLLSFASVSTGCYRMPTEGDYSTIPSTNNPTFTRQRAEPLAPQASY